LWDFDKAVVVFGFFEDRQPRHRPIEDVEDFTSRTNAFCTRHAGSITDSHTPETSPDPFALLENAQPFLEGKTFSLLLTKQHIGYLPSRPVDPPPYSSAPGSIFKRILYSPGKL